MKPPYLTRVSFDNDIAVRWKKGPQIGIRQTGTTSYFSDSGVEKGEKVFGEWTWYNLLGRIVEGHEQRGPAVKINISSDGEVKYAAALP